MKLTKKEIEAIIFAMGGVAKNVDEITFSGGGHKRYIKRGIEESIIDKMYDLVNQKSAKEMFEDIGFKLINETTTSLRYEKPCSKEWIYRIVIIKAVKKYEARMSWIGKGFVEPQTFYIDLDLNKAINKQFKEICEGK